MARSIIQTENIEAFQNALQQAQDEILRSDIIARIWKKDHTVWKEKDEEISSRLGWLSAPDMSARFLPEIKKFVLGVRKDGFEQAVLLGMGGASQAAEVLGKVFKTKKGYLDLKILDSTNPRAVLNCKNSLNPKKTLFIISSKSGTTLETISLFNFFFTWMADALGREKAGQHFIALTDPDTKLAKLGRDLNFRYIFLGDPDIGGRFSALSAFGLVPAALKGINILKLLKRSRKMACFCQRLSPQNNPGVFLGGILSVLAMAGRDKPTFIISPQLECFASWLEQLLAESTGKEGKGILPIVQAPGFSTASWGDDRIFVYFKIKKDGTQEHQFRHLRESRQPLLIISLTDVYDLGSQFFLWEMAVAAAGFFLKINPFDQPQVALTKKKTEEKLKSYKETGALPQEKSDLEASGLSLFSGIKADSLEESLKVFLSWAQPGDYLAIQAFLTPTLETTEELRNLRMRLEERTSLAVTVGFGPRFLHSTGQLHKGDRGNGLFMQMTSDDREEVPIPDRPGASHSSLTFALLQQAQAAADFEALKERRRRIIRLHLGQNVLAGLQKLISLL